MRTVVVSVTAVNDKAFSVVGCAFSLEEKVPELG